MWTMGYNEGAPDSFNGGRKLRPLIPRLSSCPTSAANTNSDNRFNMAVVTMTTEQNKREPQHPPVMVSSRWNPTPDQLRVLEELYQQGTRTPSADHIQQITTQLRRYGKIEGKNVFYWFQNHKARERQKRRRQMETGHEDSVLTTTSLVSNHGFNKKDPTTSYKLDQTKNWICSVGCETQPEKPNDDQEELVYRRVERNGRCGGEERRSFVGRTNSTLQMMHLPPPGLYPHHHRNLILNSTIVSSNISNITDTVAKDTTTVSPVFIRTRAETNTETCDDHCQDQEEECSNGELDHQEHTLELFPLRKEDYDEKEKESGIQFFYEFLPLKN